MVAASLNEHYIPQPDLDIAINNAAAARGVSLEPDRLLQLTRAATRIQASEQTYDQYGWEKPITVFQDPQNEVEVGRTAFSERFGDTAAKIDFAPTVAQDEDIVSGDTTARPEHATLFTLMAVHGLQNYVLLVDAGVIEKPAILFGDTNPQMAIVGERVGLLSDIARQNPGKPAEAHKKMREVPKMEVSGSFDEVGERAFSAETQRLERVLTRRLAAEKQAGETALHS